MTEENAVRTLHGLDFEVAKWPLADMIAEMALELGIKNDDPFPMIEWKLFRVGTCTGQWRATPEAFEVLSIVNDVPGNGHLEDALQWFEFACRERHRPLRILRFTNERFKRHLIERRGFKSFGQDDIEKWFTLEIVSCQ